MTWRTYIDGNSVGHAASHGAGKQKKLYAGDQETTAIYGMLKSMQKIMRERAASLPVVLWDGRSWRFERFPEYKANRTDDAQKLKDRAAYKSQRPAMFKGLHLLGVRQLIAGNMEADDLAALVTKRALANGDNVALITGDQDWIQLVEPGVVWVDHKTKPERKVNASNFKDFTGFNSPKAFVQGKGLAGDAGDNVKPTTGVGKDTAPLLLETFGDVETFLATPLDEAKDRYFLMHGKRMPPKCAKFHSDPEAQARYDWALGLMDLNHPSIPRPMRLTATHQPLDRAAFESFCQQYSFGSILAQMDTFLVPFLANEKEYAN